MSGFLRALQKSRHGRSVGDMNSWRGLRARLHARICKPLGKRGRCLATLLLLLLLLLLAWLHLGGQAQQTAAQDTLNEQEQRQLIQLYTARLDSWAESRGTINPRYHRKTFEGSQLGELCDPRQSADACGSANLHCALHQDITGQCKSCVEKCRDTKLRSGSLVERTDGWCQYSVHEMTALSAQLETARAGIQAIIGRDCSGDNNLCTEECGDRCFCDSQTGCERHYFCSELCLDTPRRTSSEIGHGSDYLCKYSTLEENWLFREPAVTPLASGAATTVSPVANRYSGPSLQASCRAPADCDELLYCDKDSQMCLETCKSTHLRPGGSIGRAADGRCMYSPTESQRLFGTAILGSADIDPANAVRIFHVGKTGAEECTVLRRCTVAILKLSVLVLS